MHSCCGEVCANPHFSPYILAKKQGRLQPGDARLYIVLPGSLPLMASADSSCSAFLQVCSTSPKHNFVSSLSYCTLRPFPSAHTTTQDATHIHSYGKEHTRLDLPSVLSTSTFSMFSYFCPLSACFSFSYALYPLTEAYRVRNFFYHAFFCIWLKSLSSLVRSC